MRRPGKPLEVREVLDWIIGLGWQRIAGSLALIACVVVTVHECKKYQQATVVWDHADMAPRVLPVVPLTPEQGKLLTQRLDAFRNVLIQEKFADDLTLSADEVNYLIRNYEGGGATSNLYCGITNGQLTASVSMPVGVGRYLNGDAVLSVYISGGRLCVFMESVKTRGEPLPEAYMQEIRMENLAEFANHDGSMRRMFSGIDTITVEKDHLVVRAKRRATEPIGTGR